MKKFTFLFITLFSLSLITTSCREQKSVEEKVEDVADDIEDTAEDVADDIEDTIDN